MPNKSKYVLVVENLSTITTSRDLEAEFRMAGKIRDVVKDHKERVALVEFDRSSDAAYAWKKMDGFLMDSRRWKVDYATRADFKFFGWKWFESSPSPARSLSRSHSRSPSPTTPYHKDAGHRRTSE